MCRPRYAHRVPLCETAFLTPQGLAPAPGCTGIRGQGVAIWNLEKLFPGKAAGIAPAAFLLGDEMLARPKGVAGVRQGTLFTAGELRSFRRAR